MNVVAELNPPLRSSIRFQGRGLLPTPVCLCSGPRTSTSRQFRLLPGEIAVAPHRGDCIHGTDRGFLPTRCHNAGIRYFRRRRARALLAALQPISRPHYCRFTKVVLVKGSYRQRDGDSIMASRDHVNSLGYEQEVRSPCEDGEHVAGVPSRIARIGTKGRFCFMDLPVELRLKIYKDLLVCPGAISIPPSPEAPAEETYPSVSILQTCKTINEEAIPILYSTNTFTITLPLERRLSKSSSSSSSPSPSTSTSTEPITTPPTFHLSHFRWSTLAAITTLSFQSSTEISIPKLSVSSSPRPCFSCSGKDIMARFSGCDVRYSPKGPDEYMALSVSNWVSTKVMRAELSAFQTELEDMIRGGPVLALMGGGGGGGDVNGSGSGSGSTSI